MTWRSPIQSHSVGKLFASPLLEWSQIKDHSFSWTLQGWGGAIHGIHSFVRSLTTLSWQTLHLAFWVNPKEKYWPFLKSFYKGEEEEPFCWQTLHLPFGMKPKEVMSPSFNLLRLMRNLSIWQKNIYMTLWKHILKTYTHTWGKCKSQNIHNMKR